MARRADVLVAQTATNLQFGGGGTSYIVQANNGSLYYFYIDTASDLKYRKSNDDGFTWTDSISLYTGTVTQFAVWYDRWSGINSDLIHYVVTNSDIDDDVNYRTIDTASSDALSTQTVVFAGASAVLSGSSISLTRARGGNVYCKATIDAGAEGGFFRLPNANVPNGAWDAARTNTEALATTDQAILMPGFGADNQDILCIFWDASANQISRYIYDDSANSWAESIFTGTFTDVVPNTAFPHYAATPDLTNSQIIVIAWNAIDTANADLTCWTVTESAITAKTDVVTNSTDDQALAALALDIDTGDWHAFYAGKSDGSETWTTSVNLYRKVSKDQGTTWGSEELLTVQPGNIKWITTCPRITGAKPVAWHNDIALDELMINVVRGFPRAVSMIGI